MQNMVDARDYARQAQTRCIDGKASVFAFYEWKPSIQDAQTVH